MTTETEITINDTEVLMKNISFLEKMGGRKYTLAIIIILLASALCWFAKISDSIYSLIEGDLKTISISYNRYHQLGSLLSACQLIEWFLMLVFDRFGRSLK